nr:unnamed protein product [Digitaria exilis]
MARPVACGRSATYGVVARWGMIGSAAATVVRAKPSSKVYERPQRKPTFGWLPVHERLIEGVRDGPAARDTTRTAVTVATDREAGTDEHTYSAPYGSDRIRTCILRGRPGAALVNATRPSLFSCRPAGITFVRVGATRTCPVGSGSISHELYVVPGTRACVFPPQILIQHRSLLRFGSSFPSSALMATRVMYHWRHRRPISTVHSKLLNHPNVVRLQDNVAISPARSHPKTFQAGQGFGTAQQQTSAPSGSFRCDQQQTSAPSGSFRCDQRARLVMRSKGNYRLDLNSSLYDEMALKDRDKKGVM